MDRHALYAALRRDAPVHWDRGSQAWLVARHADVTALLVDDRLSSRATPEFFSGLPRDVRRELGALEAFFDTWLVLSDGEVHARLRAALAPAFTARSVAALAAGFDDLAERLLDDLPVHGADAGRDLARPFALSAVAALLGIRPDERGRVLGWSRALLGFMGAPFATSAAGAAAQAALAELRAYVLQVVGPRGPGGVLPPLLAAEGLTDDERVAVFAQLLAGGHDPVAHCLATALDAVGSLGCGLGELPGPDPVAALVEEALRFDAPFPVAPRLARAEVALGRELIEVGDRVLLVLASANRDEAVHDEPDRFVLHRDGPRHLSFGRGDHFCLGAVVARMELGSALRAAARRWPNPGDVPLAGRAGAMRPTSLPAVPGLV